jgi:hypothetical protein
MLSKYAILLAVLPLAACGGGDDEGTSISINAQSSDGNASIASDGDGRVRVKVGDFEGSVKLPRIRIDADDFKIDGMTFYPGSVVTNVNVDAEDKIGERDHEKVTLAFESPASIDTVRDWFGEKLAENGFDVRAEGDGFAGTTKDGDPFALTLRADGRDRTLGTMTMGE